MHLLIRSLALFLTLSSSILHGATYTVSDESLEMTIERIPITHGTGDLIDLEVIISYRANMEQKDYPDFIQLRSDLVEWTTHFNWIPEDETAPLYWESMVKDASELVLENYPNIETVLLNTSVHPNFKLKYPHIISCEITRATGTTPSKIIESVSFPIKTYSIEHQGPQVIDLLATFEYVEGLGAREYPDFEAVYTQLFELLEDYPVESDYWETMIKAVSRNLLDSYPTVGAIDMRMNVYPTASVDYFHKVNCRTER